MVLIIYRSGSGSEGKRIFSFLFSDFGAPLPGGRPRRGLLLFASLTARATLVSCFRLLASAWASPARFHALAKRLRPWRGLSDALRCDAAPTGFGGAGAVGGVRSAKNAAE